MTDIDWSAQPLGRITDAALAAQLGITTARVAHARRRLGIPGFRVVRDAERLAGPGRGEIDWDSQPLGQMPDLDLARLLGTHRARVRLARVKRGIPLFIRSEAIGETCGGDRDARWYRYPITAEKCRYCLEAIHRKALRHHSGVIRWTDQGPACSGHYGALPSCAACSSPVTHAGDLCEDCATRQLRAEREACGWRRDVAIDLAVTKWGDVEDVRKGLRAFDRRREQERQTTT